MRIALVHSYYSSRQPSGENVVVDAQAAALRGAGHDVLLVAQRTDERERSSMYPIAAAWTVATGFGSDPTEDLRRFAPDVVHVHNLFPNFGTRWLDRWPGPVVATLHNFRPMCAAGTLYRAGQVCTACPDGNPGAALKHACYRGSTLATLPLAIGSRRGVTGDPVVNRADSIVLLTEAANAIYRRYGVEEERRHVVPNFVPDPYPTGCAVEPNGRWLFVGRLSAEKGLRELLAVWPRDMQLDVVGEGPLAGSLSRWVGNNVRMVGALDHDELIRRMPHYAGLVLPSRCIEGLPTVLLEGFAAGLPCVAVAGSGGADAVAQLGVGSVLPMDAPVQAWSAAMRDVTASRNQLSVAARAAFQRCFTVDTWLGSIQSVYSRIVRPVSVS